MRAWLFLGLLLLQLVTLAGAQVEISKFVDHTFLPSFVLATLKASIFLYFQSRRQQFAVVAPTPSETPTVRNFPVLLCLR